MDNIILKKLDSIEKMLSEQNILKKEVLSLDEATNYLEVSHSHLYKLTSSGKIPFYKPNNKKIYFNRKELDEWRLSNKHLCQSEIDKQTDEYLLRNGKVRL